MTKRVGVREGVQKQGQSQVQMQATMRRRAGAEELSTWQESAFLPGLSPRVGDLGYDEQADGDQLSDDGDELGSGEPAGEDLHRNDEDDEEPQGSRQLALPELLGSRPPAVLLRLSLENGELMVRRCSRPASRDAGQALDLLRDLVTRCFAEGRSHFTEDEWGQLLGAAPAPLIRRLTLLLRLAIEANAKVRLGEEDKAVFTPHDIGLERFANQLAALPDGTPFSLRLLLLDQRGRKSDGKDFFDRLPDAVKLLALRRALQGERQKKVAVNDLEFRGNIQQALEELLGTEIPRPTEDQVRRRLRDNFKRKGLGDLFPNQKERQRAYDQMASSSAPCEESA